jgi:hypothetical protein
MTLRGKLSALQQDRRSALSAHSSSGVRDRRRARPLLSLATQWFSLARA